MGLTSDAQSALSEAFDSDLADAVRSFTLTQYTKGTYDTDTGDPAATSTTYNSRGVFDSYTQPEILNSEVEPTDVKLIVLQNELGTTPAIANQVQNLSTLKLFRVVNVAKDPANVAWELQIRSTK